FWALLPDLPSAFAALDFASSLPSCFPSGPGLPGVSAFPAAASVLGVGGLVVFACSGVPGFASDFAPSGFAVAGAAPASGLLLSSGFPVGLTLPPGPPVRPPDVGLACESGSTIFV